MGEFRRTWKIAGERTSDAKRSLKKPGVEPSHRVTAGADAPGRARETRTRKSTTMTDNMLKSFVTQAVSLDREINEKTERLKELKAELIAEARSREGELRQLIAAAGGGLQKAVTAALSASPFLHRRSRRRSMKGSCSKGSRISLAAFLQTSSSLPPATDPLRSSVKK